MPESRSSFLLAQQQAEAAGREVVATLRGELRVDGLVALIDAMGIAYGADVRIQGDSRWWFLTAPKGWERAEPVYPDRDTDDEDDEPALYLAPVQQHG